MFSNSDLAGNQSNMHFTSQTQPLNSQLTQTNQPFYWNPNVNSIGTQLYYNNGMPASNVSAMPYATQTAPVPLYSPPHYQSYQPPIQLLPQWMLVPLSPFMHPASFLTNSQSSIGNTICTCNPTLTRETKSFGQGFVPPTLSNGSLEHSSWIPKLSHCLHRPWEQAAPEATASTADGATYTSVSTSLSPLKANFNLDSNENQVPEDSLSMKTSSGATANDADDLTFTPPKLNVHSSSCEKRVLESALPSKASPQVNVDNTADFTTCTSTSTSLSNMRLNHCDDSNYNPALNASPTRPTRSSMQAPLPVPPAASSESIPSIKTNKPLRYTCRCSYCRKDAFDRPRFPNGRLQHICHFRNCEKVFRSPSCLKDHLKRHTGKKYSCQDCEEDFTRKNDLLTHIGTHERQIKDVHGPKQHICHVLNCGRVFRCGWSLRRHLRLHSDKKRFICQFCNKEFTRKGTLGAHLRKTHKIVEPRELEHEGFESQNPEVLRLFCDHCDKVFVRKSALCGHVKSHKNLWLNDCAGPDRKSEDDNRTKDSTGQRKHICHIPDCGKVCSTPWHLRWHLKWHSGKTDFICQLCDKSFWRQDFLSNHLKKVHGNFMLGEPESKSSDGRATSISPRVPSPMEIDIKDNFENIKPKHACQFEGCGKIYASLDCLIMHLKTHLKNED